MKNDEEFQAKVIEILQIEDLPQEQQDELLFKIEYVANKRFANMLPELLDDEQIKQAEQMEKDGKKPEEIVDWVQTQIPKFDEMMRAIMLDLAEELQHNIKKLVSETK